MSEATVAERVARGAEWLDETRPGWERTIDLSVLDIADGCRCILGQLYDRTPKHNGYTVAKNAVVASRGVSRSTAHLWLVDRGFSCRREMAAEFRDLADAWTDLIKARFDTGALSDAQ